jgi:hypothetical protein
MDTSYMPKHNRPITPIYGHEFYNTFVHLAENHSQVERFFIDPCSTVAFVGMLEIIGQNLPVELELEVGEEILAWAVYLDKKFIAAGETASISHALDAAIDAMMSEYI